MRGRLAVSIHREQECANQQQDRPVFCHKLHNSPIFLAFKKFLSRKFSCAPLTRIQHKLRPVWKYPELATSVHENDIFTAGITPIFNVLQHPVKGFSGINGVQ